MSILVDPTLRFLLDHQQDMVDDLEAFCVRETPSTNLTLLREFAAFLAEYAHAMIGGEIEIIEDDATVQVRVTRGRKVGEQPILLLGHFDTIWDPGILRMMPFQIDNGIARGPGVFDMKAGLVQAFWALRGLVATKEIRPPVVFLMNSDEEIGSSSSRQLIEEEARRCGLVLVLEPSHGGALKTSRKGVCYYKLAVTGKAAHAGEPESGVSAITELLELVRELTAAARPERGTAVSVGVIQGGRRHNVIPDAAHAEIDVRVATREEAERIGRVVDALEPRSSGATLRVTGGPRWPPMERSSATGALFTLARSLAAELGFQLDEAAVGGASDGNFCAAVGASVLDGLGPVGGGAHSPGEHVILAEMPRRAALLARLVEEITNDRSRYG